MIGMHGTDKKFNVYKISGIIIDEPLHDKTAICGVTNNVTFVCRLYSQDIPGSGLIQPQWSINGTRYSSNDIPDNQYYSIDANSTTLTVRNIRRELNNTIFQCSLLVNKLTENGVVFCEYNSSGRLIIKDRGNHNLHHIIIVQLSAPA